MPIILKKILISISRIIYWCTPREFREERSKKKLQNIIEKKLAEDTFEKFKEHFKNSVLFYNNTKEIRKYAIETSLLNDKNNELYYLEFGVYTGRGANFFSKYVKKLYAFDSFEGLREDWVGNFMPKGHLNLNQKIPKLNPNVEPVVGWVQDTLDDFLKKHNPRINFVNFDMDTYESTKFALEKIKPYLVKNAIIIFDELYNFVGWENGEYKALNEVFNENEFKYKSFRIDAEQVVIQIN